VDSLYTGKTNPEDVKEQFWDDSMYGGPFYHPIRIYKKDCSVDRNIENDVE
jgi:hypothetical protein